MLILGLAGSPRIGGNSEALLDEALAGAKEMGARVEKVRLANYEIEPCIACGSCEKTGFCVVQDEMQQIYGKLEEADGIIITSPIYFYNVTGFAKAAIDRSQAFWARRYILKDPEFRTDRKGAFIGIGATKGSKLFEGTILTIKYFFDAIGCEYTDEYLVRNVDAKGDIKSYPEHLEEARALGMRLVKALSEK